MMATEKRLIDANAFIEYYCDDCGQCCDLERYSCQTITDLLDFPTEDAVEVVHGQWIEHKNEKTGIWHYDCSICDDGYAMKEKDYHTPNYCPNCGADMRERKENENP